MGRITITLHTSHLSGLLSGAHKVSLNLRPLKLLVAREFVSERKDSYVHERDGIRY